MRSFISFDKNVKFHIIESRIAMLIVNCLLLIIKGKVVLIAKWNILQIQYYLPKWNPSLDTILPAKIEPFFRYSISCQNGTLLQIQYYLPKWNPSLDTILPAKIEPFSRYKSYNITCQNGTILQIQYYLPKWIILQIQYYLPKQNILQIQYYLPKWYPSLDTILPAKMDYSLDT